MVIDTKTGHCLEGQEDFKRAKATKPYKATCHSHRRVVWLFQLSMHARCMDIVRVAEGLLFISKFLVQTTYGTSNS